MSNLSIEQIEKMEQIGLTIADRLMEKFSSLQNTNTEQKYKLDKLRESLEEISEQLKEVEK